MAETKAKTVELTTVPERVPLKLPLDPDPKAPKEEFFSVNGKNYLIKKGVTVLVPPEVKEVWDNAEEQRLKAYEYVDEKSLREPQ